VVFDSFQLILDILNLVILFFLKSFTLFNLLGQVLFDLILFFFGKLTQFLVSLDFLKNLLILLFNHVNLGGNLIDVIIEGIILLVSLDEGGDDFLNRTNTSLSLNLSKRIFDNMYISNIHVHQILLFLIVSGPFLKSQLQKGGWVGKLTGSSSRCISSSCSSNLGFGLLEFSVIFFSKFLLKILNAILEFVFLLFILCFQGKNLIVKLFRVFLSLVRYTI